MNRAYAETARDAARMAAKEGSRFLKDNSKYAYGIGRKVRNAYPALASNLRDTAAEHADSLREMLKAHGKHVAKNSSQLYHSGVRSFEFKLLKFGAMYALWCAASRNAKVAAAGERIKAEVHAQPVQSAVIALGIGFLIGRILG